MDVLRVARACKSSSGPSQCPPPPPLGIVCEVRLWPVVRCRDNAVRAVVFLAIDCKDQPGEAVNLCFVGIKGDQTALGETAVFTSCLK